MKFLLKKGATEKAIEEIDASILRYKSQPNVTMQQYTKDLLAKPCKVNDVFEESTLKDAFIERLELSIGHSSRQYWAQIPQADLTDIAFWAESLSSIQKDAEVTSTTKP